MIVRFSTRNYKTGHPTPSTLQNRADYPLEPKQPGFGRRHPVLSTSPIKRGTSPLSFSHRQWVMRLPRHPAACACRCLAAATSPPPRPPLRSRSPMELRGGPRGAAPGPWSCAAAGPAGARHGGLLPPPLRHLPPELRRWPSARSPSSSVRGRGAATLPCSLGGERGRRSAAGRRGGDESTGEN